MKKTLISVAAASLMMGTVASADVDVELGGQAVVYYQTWDKASTDVDMFDQKASNANVGLQVNGNADLGAGFGVGSQVSVLGTWGLENTLVNGTMQNADLVNSRDTLNGYAVTKLYLTKTLGKTTIKGGRQELPKALSPLAFSEGWNVFKNTFDAVLAINSDLPETTLVGAYVTKANNHGDLSAFNDEIRNGVGTFNFGAAYMLTAQTKLVPMMTLTGTYYSIVEGDGTGGATNQNLAPAAPIPGAVTAYWLDAQLADDTLPLGLNGAVQYGNLDIDVDGADSTTAIGAQLGGKVDMFNVSLAYSGVDDGLLTVQNVGTGVKTPLYTQMVLNQNYISHDADTYVLRAGANFGDAGAVNVAYDMTSDNSAAENDYSELDLVYTTKVADMNIFAAYVYQTFDKEDTTTGDDSGQFVRVWARYNF